MTVVFALMAAFGFGFSDFIAGAVSRKVSSWAVAATGQLAATLGCGIASFFVAGSPASIDFVWASLAGVCNGAGIGLLYRGFKVGRIAVVAPLSALGAAAAPVMLGIVTGEVLSALSVVGIVLIFPSIWLVTRDEQRLAVEVDGSTGWIYGLTSGLCLGAFFGFLGQIRSSAGLWPLTVTQFAGIFVVVGLSLGFREVWYSRNRVVLWATMSGLLLAFGSFTFMFASQTGNIAIAGVLTALYPAVTIILAVLFLREAVYRVQIFGLVVSGIAVSLIAVG